MMTFPSEAQPAVALLELMTEDWEGDDMGKRITPEEHIEGYFIRESQAKCIAARERIDLQMRTRFPDMAPAKRGRKRKEKGKPPMMAKGAPLQDADIDEDCR